MLPDTQPTTIGGGPVTRFLAMPNDHPVKTLLVALILCLVCAVAVSVAAVSLRPLQERNKDLAFKQEVLKVAGLYVPGDDVETQFKQVDARMVDLASGEYRPDLDPRSYSPQAAARAPETGTAIAPPEDLARIKRRSRFVPVYLVRRDDRLHLVILPIYGTGLWSTMYGLLALHADADTVAGVSFYAQAETAGLGAEIADRDWQAGWSGKRIYDDTGKVRFQLVKGAAGGSEEAAYGVDALSGATLTSNGVTDLVRYWLGDQGFGRYLDRIKQQEGGG